MTLRLLCCVAAMGVAMGGMAADVSLKVRTDQTIGRIDERIYSHFFEHIYHSANGGLGGELVWNRSFESAPGGRADWAIDGDELVQRAIVPDARLFVGGSAWGDYEFRLEAMRTSGAEGFLVMVRASADGAFYWLNVGGWGNQGTQFEKETGPGKRTAVGPRSAFKVEPGQWYRVRIRCEGARLRAFIDDTLVVDYTDTDAPILAGSVGVGAWVTAVRYRGLKVTGLDGNPLWSGLPPVDSNPRPAEFWEPIGTGVASIKDKDALNGRFTMALDATRGGAGIRQPAFAVTQGETYTGSLWLRGAAPHGVMVRIVDSLGSLAQCRIPRSGAEWAEKPLRMRAERSSHDAALEIVLPAGIVEVDQVSLMANAARHVGGFRLDLLKAVAALRPPVIRWPGGCYAEYYRWKDGVGPQSKRRKFPIRIWDDDDVNSLGTDEFISLCRRVGAEPLFVVNGGRHDSALPMADYIREACDWVEYCNGPATSRWGAVRAANGHREPYNVRLWEIDNETWPMGADAYVKLANAFISAMRAIDPGIKILVCGGAGTDNGFGGHWNAKVIAGCAPRFDYLSIHHYEDPDRFLQGPLDYERLLGEIGGQIAASANPSARVFVSEWNAQSTDWRTGLYAAGVLNAFERRSAVVAMASPALFLRHVSAREWDNALINFDQAGWFAAPNYTVMRLWRDSYAPARLGVEGDAGKLSVVATRTEDGRRVIVKLVNPVDETVAVTVSIDGAKRAGLTIVAPGSVSARNTMGAPNRVQPTPSAVSLTAGTARLSMRPLSLGVLTLEMR